MRNEGLYDSYGIRACPSGLWRGGSGGAAVPAGQNSSGNGDNVVTAITCPHSDAELFESESGFRCTTTTTVVGGDAGEPEPRTGVIEINRYQAFEPNDSFHNANIVEFPIVAEPTSIGVEITGTVRQSDDPSDYIVFSVTRAATYLVYLCADTCIEHPSDDKVALLVYDANHNLLRSNPLDQSSEKKLFVQFEQGLTYYVELRANNTGSEIYSYRLVVNE